MSFIPCDYADYGGYDKRQENVLSQMDAIACVSDSCMMRFKNMFPNLASKCIVCENFTDINLINKLAYPAITYPKNCVNFVTVCRLSEEKGLFRTIEILSELSLQGYKNYTWTIIGDGPEKDRLIEKVKSNRLENNIFFVGDKKNPYPYMKNATLFLLPSLSTESRR